MHYNLILGNRVYSSWSLRVWLIFNHFNIEFDHEVIPLYTADFEKFRTNHFPANAVPTLKIAHNKSTTIIWDSLAIVEYLHEQHPELGIWPFEKNQRAVARSLCAEMHSGFNSLRSTMPMNLRRKYNNFVPDKNAQQDIERIESLWNWTKFNWGENGSYLFGERYTAADAFFTPVAERFRTYSINLNSDSKKYMDTVLNHPVAKEFHEKAQSEPWIMKHNEFVDD